MAKNKWKIHNETHQTWDEIATKLDVDDKTTETLSDAKDYVDTNINNLSTVYSPIGHTHNTSDITNLATAIETEVDSKLTDAVNNLTINVSTVDGLQTILDNKTDIGHQHVSTDITDFETAVEAKVNTMGLAVSSASLTSKGIVQLNNDINSQDESQASTPKAVNDVKNHVDSEISNLSTVYSPISHTHTIAQVDNLRTELDGKSNVGHTHKTSDIENFNSDVNNVVRNSAVLQGVVLDLNNKAEKVHTHVINDVNGLQTELDKIGVLSNLNTIDKTNLVNATNEINNNLTTLTNTITTHLAQIGDLADLETDDKTSIVDAINWIYNTKQNKIISLYDRGDEKTGVTGGWSVTSYRGSMYVGEMSVDKSNNAIELSCINLTTTTAAHFYLTHVIPVDLTDVKKMTVKVYSKRATDYAGVGIYNNKMTGDVGTSSIPFLASKTITGVDVNSTLELDVTNIIGEQYIYLYFSNGYDDGKVLGTAVFSKVELIY